MDLREMVEKRLEELRRKYGTLQVQAGFLEGGITADNPRTERTIQEIASYAAENEKGGDGTPARPFMRQAIEQRSETWGKIVGGYLERGAEPADAFTKAGEIMRDDIRRSIEGEFGEWPPNSPATVAKKIRVSMENGTVTGQMAPPPLIDTGAMHRSVGYRIFTEKEVEDE